MEQYSDASKYRYFLHIFKANTYFLRANIYVK